MSFDIFTASLPHSEVSLILVALKKIDELKKAGKLDKAAKNKCSIYETTYMR